MRDGGNAYRVVYVSLGVAPFTGSFLCSRHCDGVSVPSSGVHSMVRVNSSDVSCSVVVPAYNAARTIAATVASALAQTVSDIEVIVVDDGSRDETAAIVARLADRDPRLRLIQQTNAGVSAARNAGIAAARADVIAFLDADDLWPAQHLATHLKILAMTPRLDVSFSAARYIDEAGCVVGMANPKLIDLTTQDLVFGNPTTTTSTWVVARRSFDKAGLFDTTLSRSEDQAWLVRAALVGLGIAGTTDSIVDYRISTTGLASDLAGMRAGFVDMLDCIAVDHPDFIAAHRPEALAAEDLYLARRALQIGLSHAVALNFLRSAAVGSPAHVVRNPRAAVGILVRLARVLLSSPRKSRLAPQSLQS